MLPPSLSRCLHKSLLFALKQPSIQVRLLNDDRIKFKIIEDDKIAATHASLQKITNALGVIKTAKLQITEALALIDNETKLLENKLELVSISHKDGLAVNQSGSSDKARVGENITAAAGAMTADAMTAGAMTADVSSKAVKVEKVNVEPVLFEPVLPEPVLFEPVLFEPVLSKPVKMDEIEDVHPPTTEEILKTEDVLEAASANECVISTDAVTSEPVSNPTVAESSSTIFDNIIVPTAEKITVHLAKDAILSTAQSVIEATRDPRDISVEGKVIETAVDSYPETTKEIPGTTETEAPEAAVMGIFPLNTDQLKAVQKSCLVYAPLGSVLPLPFTDYCLIKKRLRYRGIASMSIFSISGFAGFMYYGYTFFPNYFGPEPAVIMGIDSFLFMSGASLVVGGVAAYLGSTLVRQLSLGWFTGKYRKLYKERETDFLRRVAHHRCSGSSSYSDDYYGDKIADVSDYRFWIRQQQMKKDYMKKSKL